MTGSLSTCWVAGSLFLMMSLVRTGDVPKLMEEGLRKYISIHSLLGVQTVLEQMIFNIYPTYDGI